MTTSPTGSVPWRSGGKAARCAFTLIELLVVMGLMVVIMGISYGVLIDSQRGRGLPAGTALVSDLVRQARYTALSSNAPVELRIDRDPSAITGVSQVPVLSVGFDRHPQGLPSAGAPRLAADTPWPGVAGYGWVLGYTGLPSDGLLPPQDFEPQRRLMRKAGDGFYLSCWIRPPPADGNAIGVAAPASIDLLIVGTGDDPGDPSAFAGLRLLREILPMQVQGGQSADLVHWYPEGWIWAGGVQHPVSGVHEDVPLHPSTAPSLDIVAPISGESWVELGLLYDGRRLVLYRDGRELTAPDASLDVGVVAPPGDIGDFQLFIGRGNGAASAGIIDEVRVLRLGVDRPRALPQGVSPAQDYRLVAASGAIRLFDAAGNSLSPQHIVLGGSDGRNATIIIDADGNVRSRID